ncbi:DUF2543 family protein [Pantoea sp.]
MNNGVALKFYGIVDKYKAEVTKPVSESEPDALAQ